MAQQVLTNCKLWLAQYDLSGKMNAIALNDSPDMLEATVFGDGGKRRKKGFSGVLANHEGFWDSTADKAIWNNFNITTAPMTIGPITGAKGEAGYSFLSQMSQYTLGGAVGEMLKFNIQAENVGVGMVRGLILLNATKMATANETAYQVGAISATQTMYAAFHCTDATAGDTLDVVIQSDPIEGFTTATPRITFAQVTGGTETYEWKTLAGAITDAWWRVSFTIAGVDPSFTFCVFAGIK